ncbi:hypothetical protein R6258_04700, partial [Halomonas sp. HP20-15]|uniref:hypothetical protein n=1 Tax=Halomonas sp. HP20-15 TaxID=3085901 RepID=UPI002980CD3C
RRAIGWLASALRGRRILPIRAALSSASFAVATETNVSKACPKRFLKSRSEPSGEPRSRGAFYRIRRPCQSSFARPSD